MPSQSSKSTHHLPHVDKGLMWFRRDLRAFDNAALYHALKSCKQVHCVFVFDSAILDSLPTQDRRVEFIRESLVALDAELHAVAGQAGAGLIVRHALSTHEVPRLARELGVQEVFANHDEEPDALTRDAQVRGGLANFGIGFQTYKDHVIFERNEVLTQMEKPYGVFTPYKNAWLRKVNEFYLRSYPVGKYIKALAVRPKAYQVPVPTLTEIGFVTAWTVTTKRATSPPSKAPAIWACICALARCRSVSSPPLLTSACWWAPRAQRPGCRS